MMRDVSICQHASVLRFFNVDAVVRLRSPIWSCRDRSERLRALMTDLRKPDAQRLELLPGVIVCGKIYETIMDISPYMKRKVRKLLAAEEQRSVVISADLFFPPRLASAPATETCVGWIQNYLQDNAEILSDGSWLIFRADDDVNICSNFIEDMQQHHQELDLKSFDLTTLWRSLKQFRLVHPKKGSHEVCMICEDLFARSKTSASARDILKQHREAHRAERQFMMSRWHFAESHPELEIELIFDYTSSIAIPSFRPTLFPRASRPPVAVIAIRSSLHCRFIEFHLPHIHKSANLNATIVFHFILAAQTALATSHPIVRVWSDSGPENLAWVVIFLLASLVGMKVVWQAFFQQVGSICA